MKHNIFSIMKSFSLLVYLLVIIVFGLNACSDDSVSSFEADNAEITVAPNETIPVGTMVKINTSGLYKLPEGASSITTFCNGKVDLIIEYTPGSPEINTCESDGNSNQTNIVTGLESVKYELEANAFAEVIVK